MKVRLTAVEGDQEEFADLIGTEGELHLSPGNNWYNPNGRGDSLQMESKRITRKEDRITVSTHLGNKFVFRVKTN